VGLEVVLQVVRTIKLVGLVVTLPRTILQALDTRLEVEELREAPMAQVVLVVLRLPLVVLIIVHLAAADPCMGTLVLR